MAAADALSVAEVVFYANGLWLRLCGLGIPGYLVIPVHAQEPKAELSGYIHVYIYMCVCSHIH